MNSINLRIEHTSEHRTVENLTREAFWNHHGPGCNEHYLLHVLRSVDAFIPELDFVAEVDGLPVGNIVYTKAHVLDDEDKKHEVITFGPLSVLPDYQRTGIGSALVHHTLDLARNMGYGAVIIYGSPDYYSRLGFIPAESFDIATPDNMYGAPLQAFELTEGYLTGICGRFYEDQAYHIDDSDAEAFDQTFEPKEKLEGLPSQLEFLEQLKMFKPRVPKEKGPINLIKEQNIE